MAGELVPLVLLPRFTTLVGDQDFVTVAMDVTAFEKALVSAWRGVAIGTNGFVVTFQESSDQVTWSTCGGTSSASVSAGTEAQFAPTFTKRWMRLLVELGGADSAVSCWVVGFLEERLT